MPDYRVIDVDGHFNQAASVCPGRLESKFRADAPRYARDTQGRMRLVIGGEMKRAIPMPEGAVPGPDGMRSGGYDPQIRLADMDREGIDVMV